jgi:hypothetical protein
MSDINDYPDSKPKEMFNCINACGNPVIKTDNGYTHVDPAAEYADIGNQCQLWASPIGEKI